MGVQNKNVAKVMVLLYYFSKYWRTDVRTDSHLTTKYFSGAPALRRRVSGSLYLQKFGNPSI